MPVAINVRAFKLKRQPLSRVFPFEIFICARFLFQEQVRYNRFLSPRALREHIKNIEKTAVTALQESPEALCLQQKSSGNA
jgi:hypothetical protein